jgi:hypothetical protein
MTNGVSKRIEKVKHAANNNPASTKKGRTMNPLTQFKKIPVLRLRIARNLVALIALIVVPAAEAVFFPLSLQPGGPLQAGRQYVFGVSDATMGGGTAVMLQAVVRGRLELKETLTVPSGSSVDLGFTIPSRASQVILVLDPVFPGFQSEVESDVGVVVLDQNGGTIIPPFTFRDFTHHPHIEIVYEVAP